MPECNHNNQTCLKQKKTKQESGASVMSVECLGSPCGFSCCCLAGYLCIHKLLQSYPCKQDLTSLEFLWRRFGVSVALKWFWQQEMTFGELLCHFLARLSFVRSDCRQSSLFPCPSCTPFHLPVTSQTTPQIPDQYTSVWQTHLR